MTAFTAKQRWDRLQGSRTQVLQRARDAAALTIPAVIPPEGYTDNTVLPQPYQSLGARGVNNLASKLLLALFPPGQSCFRYQMDAAVRTAMGEAATDADARLSEIERRVTDNIEGRNTRSIGYEALVQLIVGGNALYHSAPGGDRVFRVDQYVIARDPFGNPVEAVVREQVSATVLKDEVKAACAVTPGPADTLQIVDVFTVIEWRNGKVWEWQEINDKPVPGSHGVRPIKRSRWLPLRWRAVAGSSYGRGHVEEYIGDLRSLEGLSMSIVQFAAAAAKILFLVRPGAITSIDDVFKTESGGAITGLKDDISTLQLEKFADFQVAQRVAEGLNIQLSHAFLLRAGTVRDAERVTAEEIRALAQELEDALGGTYTVLGSEYQLPFIRLRIQDMTADRLLPSLPDGVVEPVIITGFQALGRNHAVNRLRAFLADLAQVDPTFSSLNKAVVAKRLGTGHGVEALDELVKTPEQMAQDEQNAMMMSIAQKAAGPVLGAAAKQK